MLTHIDLFSGIGGFALAAQWAGFKTVVFCEIEPFCQEVLKARFGAVADTTYGNGTSWRVRSEIITTETGNRETIGIGYGHQNNWKSILIPDIRDFDGRRFRGATLLTGGFPCQPFSCAGKRRGKADDRWLWPEMLRVIAEAQPAWVLGENVAGIVNMELEQVCLDLEGEGYEVQPVIIPALAVNAPHRRDRVWIIAYSENSDWGTATNQDNSGRRIEKTRRPDRHAPDAESGEALSAKPRGLHAELGGTGWDEPWPEVATRLCRVDDGVPTGLDETRIVSSQSQDEHKKKTSAGRVHRLKALGNAIVPQVAYEIIKEIARIENET
jgi:DNA (cytosine-5)-methyltransferase 1